MPGFFTNMTIPLDKRPRFAAVAAALLGVVLLGAFFARVPLVRWGVRTLLERAGGDEIRFEVAHVSPWRVELRDVGFRMRTKFHSVGTVEIVREHWWTPSLGTLRIGDARVPVNIDGSDIDPWAPASSRGRVTNVGPLNLPLREIILDGQLLVQAAGMADQPVTIRLALRQTGSKLWAGDLQANGAGLVLKGEIHADPATSNVGFKVTEFDFDVAPWQDRLQRIVLLPGGSAQLGGRVTGRAAGRLEGKRLVLGGTLQLRDGRYENRARAVAAEGVEFDLEVVESAQFQTKLGSLRIRELRTGKLVISDVDAGFAFESAQRIAVSRATLTTLGGQVSVEPFSYSLEQRSRLDLVVLVNGLSVEQVLALTQDLPAKASGRVNGRLPLRIDEAGVRLSTGWLALTPGVAAQVQFTAPGLLTGGMATSAPAYPILKKLETGLLQLDVTELRLDIRPPNAPSGRSAQLRLVGRPTDPEVKAPVTLDLNVNGPLERLINMGLDSRVSFGTKP